MLCKETVLDRKFKLDNALNVWLVQSIRTLKDEVAALNICINVYII